MVSAHGRLKMRRLCVAGTMTECALTGGVRLNEVINTMFVCGWNHRLNVRRDRCLLVAMSCQYLTQSLQNLRGCLDTQNIV